MNKFNNESHSCFEKSFKIFSSAGCSNVGMLTAAEVSCNFLLDSFYSVNGSDVALHCLGSEDFKICNIVTFACHSC